LSGHGVDAPPLVCHAIDQAGDRTTPQDMKTATTWDIVCAANQHLTATSADFKINQFFPGKYEVICLDENGTTTGKRLGEKMDEQAIREFIAQVVFA